MAGTLISIVLPSIMESVVAACADSDIPKFLNCIRLNFR